MPITIQTVAARRAVAPVTMQLRLLSATPEKVTDVTKVRGTSEGQVRGEDKIERNSL